MEEKKKRLKAKSVHKHELEVHWLQSSYVPDKGELVVYDAEVDKEGNVLELPVERVKPYAYPRMKLGDGEHTVNELEFSGGAENMVLYGDGELSDEDLPGDEPEEEGQLAYRPSSDGTYYIVTGRGTVKGSSIVIPSHHDGKPVAGILSTTFNGDAEVTSLTLGNYITYVPEECIEGMPNLQELYWNGHCSQEFLEIWFSGDDWTNIYADIRWFVHVQGAEWNVYAIGTIEGGEISSDFGPSGNILPRYKEVCGKIDDYNEEYGESCDHSLVVDAAAG